MRACISFYPTYYWIEMSSTPEKESISPTEVESQIKTPVKGSPPPERVNPLDNWQRPTGWRFYLIYVG